MFALKYGLRTFPNQELRAQGVANLVGGLFTCVPMAGSLSRSVVQENSGCK
jgi:solute carrier family 26 protein